MKSPIAEYYTKIIELTDKYLQSLLTDYEALIELKKLNAQYESLIGKENLTNTIPRVSYSLSAFEIFLADPIGHKDELSYLKNNWMPSTC